MTTRRGFLAGLLATGLAPQASWADVGSPAFLSAAKLNYGSFALFGLSAAGQTLFQIPLPDRGHAATAHPDRPEAVAFARRPGTFAIVIDCLSGSEKARLIAPIGRHFYGHGAFSSDGELLFTTENDFEAGQGVIGIWNARRNYERIGEFSSGGVGPHEIKLLADGDGLAIANGGIETHPEAGREKLNLPWMKPNLTIVEMAGTQRDQLELPDDLHLNSIRHIAVGSDGLVAFAMQWQGGRENPPLLGLYRPNRPYELLQAPAELHRELQGYLGSVALSADGEKAAVTGSRGDVVQVFSVETNELTSSSTVVDAGGVAASGNSFAVTTGAGRFSVLDSALPDVEHALAWDNHLIAVS